MSLSISQSVTAIGPNLITGFLGISGVPPYTYAVLGGGAGGTIDGTGSYTSPAIVPEDPSLSFDTIQVTDSVAAVATTRILVGNVLQLFCDIIANQMGLAVGRVYLWDQKIFQPADEKIYIAVSVVKTRPFGNTLELVPGSGLTAMQYCNMQATLGIDIMSRGPFARDRKEEVIMALQSIYAQQQMEQNSFSIARLPILFTNLSLVDGAAIPYRFHIDVNIQYTVPKAVSVPYFDNFSRQVTIEA